MTLIALISVLIVVKHLILYIITEHVLKNVSYEKVKYWSMLISVSITGSGVLYLIVNL